MPERLVCYYRNGRVVDIGHSIKDIVIGYDMIPLIGIRRMRRRLEAKGSFHRVRIRASAAAGKWCLFRNGRPVAMFLAWQGGFSKTKGGAAISACGFIADFPEVPLADQQHAFDIFMSSRMPARPQAAMELLRRFGFDVCRAKIVMEVSHAKV